MRRSELTIFSNVIIGIIIWTVLIISHSEALRGSAVVLQAKSKAAEQKSEVDEENNTVANVTKPSLTGIPQIDYILDPNLPRELNGHNLTDYPFYNSVPEDIDFRCDGLHDGFYASVVHKCQVYHHCLFGTRFDFLCANYTAFDQRTFICHFVSEVDCVNSPKYYIRNEALYKADTTTTTTTTAAPTTSTTTVANTPAPNVGRPHGSAPRRRRPYRRRRPMYEYYYDDDDYLEPEYYDDETALSHRRIPYRKQNKAQKNYGSDHDVDYDAAKQEQVRPAVRNVNSGGVYDRPRAPPKIRPPVPKNERDKYDYAKQSASTLSETKPYTTKKPTTAEDDYDYHKQSAAPEMKQVSKKLNTEEYYEDDEYEYVAEPKGKKHVDYDFPTGVGETRRYTNRFHSRAPSRKRVEYDDYEDRPPMRSNRRKEHRNRPAGRGKARHEDKGYNKKRVMDEHRPDMKTYEDDYYYEDEEEMELPKRPQRLQKVEKTKSATKPKHEQVDVKFKPVAQRNNKGHERDNEIPTTEVVHQITVETKHKVELAKTEETSTENRVWKNKEAKKEPEPDAIVPSRHFVIATPVHKPSQHDVKSDRHPGDQNKLKVQNQTYNYRINAPTNDSPSKFKTLNTTNNYRTYTLPAHESEKPYNLQNHTYSNYHGYAIQHDENFLADPKQFERPTQSPPQQQRLFTNPDTLYTNAISFPQRAPSGYDITAPGPSAPAEQRIVIKKFPEPVAYTNLDYDVAFNDALQPSTLHPVRNYPPSAFNAKSQTRILPVTEYIRNDRPAQYSLSNGGFQSALRSQRRYN